MKKRVVFIVMSLLLVSGCGAKIPELSEEEGALIAEYAVGSLMKHQKDNGSRLVDTKAIEEAMQQSEAEKPIEVPEETQSQIQEQTTQQPMTDSADVVDNTQTPAFKDIASFLQLEGLDIQYSGYEICDLYPQDEISLSVQPSMGKALLVAKFTVNNISGQEVVVDLFAQNIKGRVAINGNETYRALTTMLLNDLSTFAGSILPGEIQELVLVMDIPKDQAESLQTVIMTLKTQNGTMDIDLMQ